MVQGYSRTMYMRCKGTCTSERKNCSSFWEPVRFVGEWISHTHPAANAFHPTTVLHLLQAYKRLLYRGLQTPPTPSRNAQSDKHVFLGKWNYVNTYLQQTFSSVNAVFPFLFAGLERPRLLWRTTANGEFFYSPAA